MFNLLITYWETQWEGDGRFKMDKDRFKEHSGQEASAIEASAPETMKALENLPTILMYEINNKLEGAEKGHYGYMRDIRVEEADVTFEFVHRGSISRTELLKNSTRLQFRHNEEYRTHWAVKDGDIPQDIVQLAERGARKFDVVLSYATEDQDYVRQVAKYLDENSVQYFFDQNETVDLWGKNVAEQLYKVFSKLGRFCVMFISRHYASKVWATHERRSALSRQIHGGTEYILPVRLDNTEIEGLPGDICYLKSDEHTPEELGQIILEKIRRTPRRVN